MQQPLSEDDRVPLESSGVKSELEQSSPYRNPQATFPVLFLNSGPKPQSKSQLSQRTLFIEKTSVSSENGQSLEPLGILAIQNQREQGRYLQRIKTKSSHNPNNNNISNFQGTDSLAKFQEEQMTQLRKYLQKVERTKYQMEQHRVDHSSNYQYKDDQKVKLPYANAALRSSAVARPQPQEPVPSIPRIIQAKKEVNSSTVDYDSEETMTSLTANNLKRIRDVYMGKRTENPRKLMQRTLELRTQQPPVPKVVSNYRSSHNIKADQERSVRDQLAHLQFPKPNSLNLASITEDSHEEEALRKVNRRNLQARYSLAVSGQNSIKNASLRYMDRIQKNRDVRQQIRRSEDQQQGERTNFAKDPNSQVQKVGGSQDLSKSFDGEIEFGLPFHTTAKQAVHESIGTSYDPPLTNGFPKNPTTGHSKRSISPSKKALLQQQAQSAELLADINNKSPSASNQKSQRQNLRYSKLSPDVRDSRAASNSKKQRTIQSNLGSQVSAYRMLHSSQQKQEKSTRGFVNSGSKDGSSHKKQVFTQMPPVNQLIVGEDIAVGTSFKQHYINQSFNQEEDNLNLIEKFQPKSDILKQVDISDFVIKKYKNGVYFGQTKTVKAKGGTAEDDHKKPTEVVEKQIKQGYGCIFYYNGRLYEGEFKNDVKCGHGLELYPDNSRYQGRFENGMKSGKGRFVWTNGEIYDGQWAKGKKHGSGMWRNKPDSNGSCESYIGQWSYGKVEGFGVHTTASGDRYEGEFKNSLKEGHGTQRFCNGDVYVGAYVKGRQNGYGEYYYGNGDTYKGEFSNSLRHGKGIYVEQETGNSYEGDFQNDKKCGHGQYSWKNGDMYVGNFQNDLRHGYGQMMFANTRRAVKGYWVNGEKFGEPLDGQPVVHRVLPQMAVHSFESSYDPRLPPSNNPRPSKSTSSRQSRSKQRVIPVHKSPLPIQRARITERTGQHSTLQKSRSPGYKRSCGCSKHKGQN